MRASELKQGQLFWLNERLYRRVYWNGYIKTMVGASGLHCIIGTNDTSLTLVMLDNTVIPFDEKQ